MTENKKKIFYYNLSKVLPTPLIYLSFIGLFYNLIQIISPIVHGNYRKITIFRMLHFIIFTFSTVIFIPLLRKKPAIMVEFLKDEVHINMNYLFNKIKTIKKEEVESIKIPKYDKNIKIKLKSGREINYPIITLNDSDLEEVRERFKIFSEL